MLDYLVFIGRFQPFHRAHYAVVQQALRQAKAVILCIGSYQSPRTISNPWVFAEREAIIRSYFSADENQRIHCVAIIDSPYDDKRWQKSILQAVVEITGKGKSVGLIGHYKDHSSYYLGLFPEWRLLSVENIDHINATDIRRLLFTLPKGEKFHSADLSDEANHCLQVFRNTDEFQRLLREYVAIQRWKEDWSHTPYPPVFVTVDALVVCGQSVLMIRRKGDVGHGLWALPGGFIEQHETLAQAAQRELFEETGLKLAQSAIAVSVFDHPDRSARGRTITHVHHYVLSGTTPHVHGQDDAQEAKWIPLADIQREECFEDHYSIIEMMSAV